MTYTYEANTYSVGPDRCIVCGNWRRIGYRNTAHPNRFVCRLCAKDIAKVTVVDRIPVLRYPLPRHG